VLELTKKQKIKGRAQIKGGGDEEKI
jgi:hypothetical protein